MAKNKLKRFEKTGNWEEYWTNKNYINIYKGKDGKYDVNVFPAPVTNTDDVIETWLGVDKNKVKEVLKNYDVKQSHLKKLKEVL